MLTMEESLFRLCIDYDGMRRSAFAFRGRYYKFPAGQPAQQIQSFSHITQSSSSTSISVSNSDRKSVV